MTMPRGRTMMQAQLFTLSLILATAFGFLRPSPWNRCNDALTKPCNKQTFARPSKAFGSLYFSHESSASSCDLPSAYPPGTPAGLRGEAVRSALRSGQCLGWNLADTPLEFGVVHLSGSGCLDFLNNKLTQSFENKDSINTFKEACLLTPKGRVIDRLGVAVEHAESAYLITSPGHTSAALYQRLDPYIFPLDQVVLKDCSTDANAFVFTLASTQPSHVQSAFGTYMLPSLSSASSTIHLPKPGSCTVIPLSTDNDKSCLLIVPTCAGMPPCAAVTYTFVFFHDTHRLGASLWESMISEQNMQGPVEIGAAEWESLRIESGLPGFAKEFTGHLKDAPSTPATPLELFLQADTLNLEKGCYLGQEGVASVLKNPRGPPRLLYQVVFEDDFNLYDEYQQPSNGNDDDNSLENLTRLPTVGDTLYVLGSNQEIAVGSLTSVAEPGSTGEPVTLGLVLARRADSILKAMQARDLQLVRSTFMDNNDDNGSGMIAPPPLDPLDGLEVIVGDSFTVGQLRMIPSRRLPRGAILFGDSDVSVFDTQTAEEREQELRRVDATSMNDEITWADVAAATATDWDAVQVVVDEDTLVRDDHANDEDAIDDDDAVDDDEKALQLAMEEAAKAQSEADAAAAEAKRKAEKMELLRQKAEEAMARRKQKKK